jgi:dTMP kinase
MFVTFECLDGSGKSTQAELLCRSLEAAGHDVVFTREPGGTSLGEGVRQLLLGGTDTITAWSEAALFTAARAQLVEEVIRPALERGADVVCDRYLDSSLAYQGLARGLGIERVLQLNLEATGGLLPDLTFLLLVDPEESHARLGVERDRIEREDGEFRARVDQAYRELAELFPRRVIALDGSRAADEIAEEIHGRLRTLA